MHRVLRDGRDVEVGAVALELGLGMVEHAVFGTVHAEAVEVLDAGDVLLQIIQLVQLLQLIEGQLLHKYRLNRLRGCLPKGLRWRRSALPIRLFMGAALSSWTLRGLQGFWLEIT